MTELLIDLDFACCNCESCVGVKLKCSGKGLEEGGIAAVNVPCPTCHSVNELFFEPHGGVRAVRPHRAPFGLLEPSLN